MSIVCWSVHLSDNALHLISTVCPIYLLNSFLTIPWMRDWGMQGARHVHGHLSAATGVRPQVGGPMCP